MSRNSTPVQYQRALPRSPAQSQQHVSFNTTPTVYSFARDAVVAPPPPAVNTTALPSSYGFLPPDTPPRPLVHHLGGVNVSPARRIATTPVAAALPSRRGASPSMMSPFVGAPPAPPPPPPPPPPPQSLPAAVPPAPVHYDPAPSFAPAPAAYDRTLVDSLANLKRAEAAAAELQRTEALLRETSRDSGEKLRAAQGKLRALQMERDGLHRTSLEQADTIAKLREQMAQLGRGRAAAERLRADNTQLKERLKETEARLREADAARGELHRRLGEQERSVHTRTANASDLRGQLHSKDELVSTLSETVRARDATLTQLSADFQVLSDQLGKEQSDHRRNVQRLEQAVVEAKERELLLRQQLGDARAEAEAVGRDRDNWRSQCEAAQIRHAALAQRAMDDVVELELLSRGALELTFAHMTQLDHMNAFSRTVKAASAEHRDAVGKIARLLDDTDELVKELRYAQDMAKSGVKEREMLGGEVGRVCDIATDAMRNLELLTSSASWRRAVLETLIPEEIATSVAQIRNAVAEITHRSNLVSRRALRKA